MTNQRLLHIGLKLFNMKFEFLRGLRVYIVLFLLITPCSLVFIYQRFGELCCVNPWSTSFIYSGDRGSIVQESS
jgi:hypothetical protein